MNENCFKLKISQRKRSGIISIISPLLFLLKNRDFTQKVCHKQKEAYQPHTKLLYLVHYLINLCFISHPMAITRATAIIIPKPDKMIPVGSVASFVLL